VSRSRPAVYIVVLTYNAREEARACLRSLRGLAYPNCRVVVVDNASSDGTEAAVRAEFPDLAVIQTGRNLGYTGGNNRGIEYALERGAEYVLVLNPDTTLACPRFLDEMVAYCEAHPRVGVAGPRVFRDEGGAVQNTVLFAPGLWRNLRHWVRYRLDPDFAALSGDEVVEAEAVSGVCLLLRAACLREIGLFDENMFMYLDEADLDYRARRRGWQVRYLPVDGVVHRQKAEGYGVTGEVNFLLKRNAVYFLRKVGRRSEAWAYAGLSLALLLARALWPFAREGFAEQWRFCRRLAAAYRLILTGRPPDASFGPPH